MEKLFALLRNLQRQGITILYISHRLEETFKMANTITVLKDGIVADTVLPSEVTTETLINKMIGRKLTALFPPILDAQDASPDEILRVEHLEGGSKVRDVSFSLHRGEILGIAGMVGSGRTELVRAIFGADGKDAGKLFLQNRLVSIKSPADAVQHGIGLVPEDRKAQGVLLPFSISQNIGIAGETKAGSLFALLHPRKERERARELAEKLNIRAHDVDMEVADLSGGNQQKVVLAKWLSQKCKFIMFDEPTRGIDVGAKAEIYGLLLDLKKRGVGVILVSSELLEIVGLCNRVLVMNRGRIAGRYCKDLISRKRMSYGWLFNPAGGKSAGREVQKFATPIFVRATEGYQQSCPTKCPKARVSTASSTSLNRGDPTREATAEGKRVTRQAWLSASPPGFCAIASLSSLC